MAWMKYFSLMSTPTLISPNNMFCYLSKTWQSIFENLWQIYKYTDNADFQSGYWNIGSISFTLSCLVCVPPFPNSGWWSSLIEIQKKRQKTKEIHSVWISLILPHQEKSFSGQKPPFQPWVFLHFDNLQTQIGFDAQGWKMKCYHNQRR